MTTTIISNNSNLRNTFFQQDETHWQQRFSLLRKFGAIAIGLAQMIWIWDPFCNNPIPLNYTALGRRLDPNKPIDAGTVKRALAKLVSAGIIRIKDKYIENLCPTRMDPAKQTVRPWDRKSHDERDTESVQCITDSSSTLYEQNNAPSRFKSCLQPNSDLGYNQDLGDVERTPTLATTKIESPKPLPDVGSSPSKIKINIYKDLSSSQDPKKPKISANQEACDDDENLQVFEMEGTKKQPEDRETANPVEAMEPKDPDLTLTTTAVRSPKDLNIAPRREKNCGGSSLEPGGALEGYRIGGVTLASNVAGRDANGRIYAVPVLHMQPTAPTQVINFYRDGAWGIAAEQLGHTPQKLHDVYRKFLWCMHDKRNRNGSRKKPIENLDSYVSRIIQNDLQVPNNPESAFWVHFVPAIQKYGIEAIERRIVEYHEEIAEKDVRDRDYEQTEDDYGLYPVHWRFLNLIIGKIFETSEEAADVMANAADRWRQKLTYDEFLRLPSGWQAEMRSLARAAAVYGLCTCRQTPEEDGHIHFSSMERYLLKKKLKTTIYTKIRNQGLIEWLKEERRQSS